MWEDLKGAAVLGPLEPSESAQRKAIGLLKTLIDRGGLLGIYAFGQQCESVEEGKLYLGRPPLIS
jgi:hypothetical protein